LMQEIKQLVIDKLGWEPADLFSEFAKRETQAEKQFHSGRLTQYWLLSKGERRRFWEPFKRLWFNSHKLGKSEADKTNSSCQSCISMKLILICGNTDSDSRWCYEYLIGSHAGRLKQVNFIPHNKCSVLAQEGTVRSTNSRAFTILLVVLVVACVKWSQERQCFWSEMNPTTTTCVVWIWLKRCALQAFDIKNEDTLERRHTFRMCLKPLWLILLFLQLVCQSFIYERRPFLWVWKLAPLADFISENGMPVDDNGNPYYQASTVLLFRCQLGHIRCI
jgi:hypothetical protein